MASTTTTTTTTAAAAAAAEDSRIGIVGLSGRFPECNSVSEFLEKLWAGEDLLTTDDRRWPAGVHGIPERHGQLPDLEALDASFFQIHGSQAEKLDPQLRLLLESTFEALNDAGLSPERLRGSNTGVFVGACFSDMHDYTLRDASEVLGYENTGCAHSMFANRLSFAFDWQGPSYTVDTACSSSLVAFVNAVKALRDGDCDIAVVAGSSVTLRPEANLAFQKLHMLSPDGACMSFDTRANGYARSEAIGVIVLASERAMAAANADAAGSTSGAHVTRSGLPHREPYAYVRGCACNNDGFTTKGITFPNGSAQASLNRQVCHESGLHPSDIDYIEAHGTGTVAGDGVELKALDEVYGQAHTPDKPLLLGSVKSNMGHSEGAAGVMGLIKVLTAFDHGCLPGNLHYQNPNASTTDCLVDGRVKVVDKLTPFDGRFAAVSSFGFGGTNAHVVLERGSAQLGMHTVPSSTASFATVNQSNTMGSTLGHCSSSSANLSATLPRSVSSSPHRDAGFDSDEEQHEGLHSGRTSETASTDGDAASPLEQQKQQQESGSSQQTIEPLKTNGAKAISSVIDAVMTPFQLPDWMHTRMSLAYGRTDAATQRIFAARAQLEDPMLNRLPEVLGPPLQQGSKAWVQDYFPFRACTVDKEVQTGRVERIKTVPSSPTSGSTSDDNVEAKEEADQQQQELEEERPVYFMFTGNGGIWLGMAYDLYQTSDLFRDTLDEAQTVAEEVGCDIMRVFTRNMDDPHAADDLAPAEAMMAQVAVQIGLVRLLWSVGIRADGLFGHSAGEIACGYADGAIDLRQAILVAFHRNDVVAEAQLDEGNMYACGLSREEAEELVKDLPEVCVACINDPRGVTISGRKEQVQPIAEQLQERGVFCRFVPTKGIAHHSPMLAPLRERLVERLATVIPDAATRSENWISTCCVGTEQDAAIAPFASGEYFAHNFVSPVEFVQCVQQLPESAIVIEVGPHALLASPLRRSRPEIKYIPCMKKGLEAVVTFCSMFGALWRTGHLDSRWLQAGVGSCAPAMFVDDRNLREALVGWDHSMQFPVPKFVDMQKKSGVGGSEVVYDLEGEDAFMFDHVIDSKPLVPAAGYVFAAWKAVAAERNLSVEEVPVRFTNFEIHQAVQMASDMQDVKLRVALGEAAGGSAAADRRVEVTRDGELICSGLVRVLEQDAVDALTVDAAALQCADREAVDAELFAERDSANTYNSTAFYTTIKRRGYDYGPYFRPVERITRDGRRARLTFPSTGEWIVFIDGMLQTLLSPTLRTNSLAVPTKVGQLDLNPAALAEDRKQLQQSDSEEQDAEDRDVSTSIAIKPWRNAAVCRWAALNALEMKPLKRNVEHLEPTLQHERWVPMLGSVSIVQDLVPTQERAAYVERVAAAADGVSTTDHEEDEQAVLAVQLEQRGEQEASSVLLSALTDASSLLRVQDLLFSSVTGVKTAFEVVEHALGLNLAVLEANAHPGMLTKTVAHRSSVEQYDAAVPSTEDSDLCEAIDNAVGGPAIVQHADWDVMNGDCVADMTESYDAVVAHNLVLQSKLASSNATLSELLARLAAPLRSRGFIILVESVGPVVAALAQESGSEDAATLMDTVSAALKEGTDGAVQPVLCVRDSSGIVSTMVFQKVQQASVEDTAIACPRRALETPERFESWRAALLEAESAAESNDARVFLCGPERSGLAGMFKCLIREGHTRLRLVLTSDEESVNATEGVVPAVELVHPAVMAAGVDVGIVRVTESGDSAPVLHTMTHEDTQLALSSTTAAASASNLGAFLHFAQPGDLNSAEWVAQDRYPSADAVVVDVSTSALNFKDVMLAYGKIDQSAFYGREPPRSVGFEFAGVERESGRRVMGMADDALATVVYAAPSTVWTVPDAWSMSEAASVPVVYATAYYALMVRGCMRAGQSVLIHAGTGGVGQAAIRIALNRGCRVFTTCSTQEKRDFLLSTFPDLRAENIFNSRTTEFEDQIMDATDGAGVDLVLNSLSEDKLQASIRCVTQHGHFLEIGKFDIMEHTSLDMHILVKNVTVHGIDVDQLKFNAVLWAEVHALVREGMASGEVQPLPVKTFGADAIPEMFRFMGEGKHIGKVLLTLEQDGSSGSGNTPQGRTAYLAPKDKAFVVSGGLGGFGLELGIWLAERGARYIVLTSRRGVAKGEQANAIARMEQLGACVHISTASLADTDSLRGMLSGEEARVATGNASWPSAVETVFHLAMVLRDGRFENLEAENWGAVLGPKVEGTDNLLSVCEELGVAQVVPFSSIAAGTGNAGQTSYAYANSFMDRLAEQEAKTVVSSVQWGTIGDVGVAANTLDDRFLREHVIPQPLMSCLDVLERVLLLRQPGVVMSYIPATKTAGSDADKADVVAAVLSVLRLPRDAVSHSASLESLGMDSMQSVEVQSAVRRAKGVNVPVDQLQKMTLEQLEEDL